MIYDNIVCGFEDAISMHQSHTYIYYMYCTCYGKKVQTLMQGIPQQPGTGQIARLIAFPSSYFVFKNENVKVKVKYRIVLQDTLL